MTLIRRIISGGQTGADRAALDYALWCGILVGGWCPAGRRAEDGKVPPWYPLRETPSGDYRQRTAWNIRDSHATVICTLEDTLTGGSKLTRDMAANQGRPWLHAHGEAWDAGHELGGWLLDLYRSGRTPQAGLVLNVAGGRQSRSPAIAGWVHQMLSAMDHATDGMID